MTNTEDTLKEIVERSPQEVEQLEAEILKELQERQDNPPAFMGSMNKMLEGLSPVTAEDARIERLRRDYEAAGKTGF